MDLIFALPEVISRDWERDVDPNQLPPSDIPIRALTSIAVFVLRKRPERRSFFSDEKKLSIAAPRRCRIG